MEGIKQSVAGFRVVGFQSKNTKDGGKLRVVLEGPIDEIKAGEHDLGVILKSLSSHQEGETEVGLNLFVG